MDDPVHAFDVGEYDHGPGATAAAFAEYAVESLLAGDLLAEVDGPERANCTSGSFRSIRRMEAVVNSNGNGYIRGSEMCCLGPLDGPLNRRGSVF
jgi:hypothetical protein